MTSRPSRLALAGLLAVLASCSDATIAIPKDSFALGQGRFRLDLSDQQIVLRRDGQALVTLDPTSFQVGVVTNLGTDRSWDPWDVEERGEDEAGVRFLTPIGWSPTSAMDGTDATIDLDYGGGIHARVDLALASASRFTLTLSPDAPAPGEPQVALARVRVRTSGDATEGFYGLGEQLDSVDNRSKLRAMQLEVDDRSETNTNDAHAPVPLLVGSHGWAMFVASQRVGVFDVARKDPSVVEATFAVASTAADGLPDPFRVDLFAADAPLDLYREYYAATGPVRPPPPWSLGPWFWRNTNRNEDEVLGDMQAVRSLDLPASGFWINRPYESAVNSFDFDASRFADPPGLVAAAHAAGLKLALWSTPYLEAAAEPMFGDATSKGYFPKTVGTTSNPWGPPFDFTSPDASAYWRGLVRRYTGIGVDGFKLDYGEDVVPSLAAGARNVWTFSDGSDERTMQHRFSNLYHRVYSDAASGREPDLPVNEQAPLPFMLVRGAHWGEQSLGVVLSAGELDATFNPHGAQFASREGSDVVGVGGLPTSIVMGLSLAASGFSYFSSGSGGYLHGPADKELFVRWVEQTALSTVMEVGDASNGPAWAQTAENGRDSEAVGILRNYARLHTRLFPYLWTYAQRMVVDGRPLQRPLGLAYPELGRHPDDEYMLGDDLLVAPVIAANQTTRELLVPNGTWFGFWDGAPLVASQENGAQAAAPLDTIPLFVREGAIVPMLRPTIDTLTMATDPFIESFERDAGSLWALVVPGPPRAIDLWDGAHVARTAPGIFEVKDGTVFKKGFVLELLGTSEPTQVLRADAPLPHVATLDVLAPGTSGWAWSSDRHGTLLVQLAPGDARLLVR